MVGVASERNTMAIFDYAGDGGSPTVRVLPDADKPSTRLWINVQHRSGWRVETVDLPRGAVEVLRDALTEWLEPKPCPTQYPYGHRCQVAAGHNGPHRFEVTW